MSRRVVTGLRYLLVTAVLVTVVGLVGRLLAWPLITSTVGPTAYVFASHPDTESARARNAVVGHTCALAVGLASLAIFGLWNYPSVSAIGAPTLAQVGAAAVATGGTLLLLELLRSHHAPAAATALLVSTGLAKPGPGLIGLVLGLAMVIALGPYFSRWPVLPGRPRSDGR
ncbi:MAG: HPP family protein [Candidatus Dormibacteria bacterium]